MFPPNGYLSYKNFIHEIGERMKSQNHVLGIKSGFNAQLESPTRRWMAD